MKIILIGMSGAGKSTFSRELEQATGFPTLHLDKLWHTTDYSEEAKIWFREQQTAFIAAHEDWIIDGNYSSTFDVRLPEADIIFWLKVGRLRAISRVIRRSLRSRRLGHNRSDMATNFKERFDKEYWDFMVFIWRFPKKHFPQIETALAKFDKIDKVQIIKNRKDKEKALAKLVQTAGESG